MSAPTPPVSDGKDASGSYIYIFQAGNGPVKIGVSRNPRKRLSSLQTGCPWDLQIVLVAGCDKPSAVEERYHEQYSEYNTTGEWFELPQQEVRSITRQIHIDGAEIIHPTEFKPEGRGSAMISRDAIEHLIGDSDAPNRATPTIKEINGNDYYYLQWREDGRLKSEYVARVPDDPPHVGR